MSQTMVVKLVNCQMVGLGISSVTDDGVYVCRVSEGMIGYI